MLIKKKEPKRKVYGKNITKKVFPNSLIVGFILVQLNYCEAVSNLLKAFITAIKNKKLLDLLASNIFLIFYLKQSQNII
jgi:hypothetical protein